MNICLVTSAPLPPYEGIGFYVWNLAQNLVQRGHQVDIITRGSIKPTSCEVRANVTIWRPTFIPVYPLHVYLHSLFVNQVIRQIDGRVDLYHLHTPLPPTVRTQKPQILTVHTPMQADVGSIKSMTLQAILVRLQLAISVRIELSHLQQASRVTAVACSVAQELAAYGIEPDNVTIIPNAVDNSLFVPGNGPADESDWSIMAAGRLGLRKGWEDLIACAALLREEFPDAHFLIAGDGPLRRQLESQIARLGLNGYVRLPGQIGERPELIGLYQRAALFVHPAHYEGMPTVILEAMSCECPVIATNVSGIPDVIKNDVNGALVPAHDPEALAMAIGQLLRDPTRRNRLGRAARETILEHYTWAGATDRFTQLYQECIDNHGHGS